MYNIVIEFQDAATFLGVKRRLQRPAVADVAAEDMAVEGIFGALYIHTAGLGKAAQLTFVTMLKC